MCWSLLFAVGLQASCAGRFLAVDTIAAVGVDTVYSLLGKVSRVVWHV